MVLDTNKRILCHHLNLICVDISNQVKIVIITVESLHGCLQTFECGSRTMFLASLTV